MDTALAEVKSLVNKKKVDDLTEVKAQLKSIIDKQAEFDKVLSDPQFKGRMEQMDELLETKSQEMGKKTGPLDAIR